MNIVDLQKEIPYRWRVQSFSKYKPQATCVAYIDARDAMKILDDVCSPENWQDDYKEVSGMLFGGIGIKINEQWIWKWDTGSESNIEKEKGHVSDSFKRAAVKWGIGRFLYDLDVKYVVANEKKDQSNYPYVVDDSGQRVWDLTKHINSMNGKPPKKQSPPPPKTPAERAETGQGSTQAAKKKKSPRVAEAVEKHASPQMKKAFAAKERDFVYCVKQMLWEMAGEIEKDDKVKRQSEAGKLLYEFSTFEGNNGEMVDGFTSFDFLETLLQTSPERLRTLYGIIKTKYLYLEKVAELNGGTPPEEIVGGEVVASGE